MSNPKEDTHWNSWRNVEAKRLLRPDGAKGAKQLAAHMSEAGSIVVNLVPLSGDEMRALSEGLRRARGMTCIRLVREARGGGLPVRTTKALESRQLASSVAARARAAGGPTAGRSQEDVLPLLGQRLADHVARSKTLLELEVGVDLGAGAMGRLGAAIARSQSLRRVSFRDSEMGDASFSALVDGVRRNDKLRDVDLSGCALTDASDAAVASVVRARAGRRAVEAWERNLRRYDGDERDDGEDTREDTTIHAFGGDDDFLSSAETRNRPGLARLELSYNRIGPATVEAMCAALRQDVELRALGMRACLVSDADAARLGKAMREHPALELVALGQSRVAGARLGALRVDVVGVVDGKKPSPPAKEAGEPGLGSPRRRRDVFMDMEWRPDTPRADAEARRRAAERRAARDAAKRSENAARPATAQPATARERSRLEMETRRGWSPASGATASKWHAMGTHTSAARPHSALPKSPFAPRTNVDSSDSSEGRATRDARKGVVGVGGGGGGGGPSLRRAAAEAAGSGAWTRPKLGRAKASAVLAGLTGAPTAVPASASSEKMLVRSLTKALRSLARDPEASADPEALRRRVAAAARAAQTLADTRELADGTSRGVLDEDYGGTKSARMMARVRADMRALSVAEGTRTP